MTTDTTRTPLEQASEDAVQQLRGAWVQMQRCVQLVNTYSRMVPQDNWAGALEQIKAAQGLIHGVAEAINAEHARRALEDAS
jgi:hypothetical protein